MTAVPATTPARPGPPARVDLTKFALLSVAAAVLTIALKVYAWRITGSVGLLSDAAESVVNLVAAVTALFALRVAARPEDKNHHFGHAKAEYFSAAIEGQMIFIAACVIIWTAVQRLLHPAPIESVGIGLAVSVVASLVNGACALVLLRAGREHRSITLTADGKHLMTDVITSAGVVVGVALVWISGLQWLDPVVALLVGLNIIVTGWKLLQESADGLMDISLPKEDNARISEALGRFVTQDVHFHGLRTREAGHRRYAEVHVLVPGSWTVTQGHDLVEDVEAALREELPDVTLVCHLEPNDDPRSYDDYPTEFPVPDHAEMQRRAGVGGAF